MYNLLHISGKNCSVESSHSVFTTLSRLWVTITMVNLLGPMISYTSFLSLFLVCYRSLFSHCYRTSDIIESSTPFATPLHILPEWYFFPTFNMLRALPNKCIGILSMLYLATFISFTPFLEHISKYQNPWRRPVIIAIFLFTTCYSIWLSIGSLVSIVEALSFVV